MPWDYPGFDSEEEYVQFWLPRIGLRDTARALSMTEYELRKRWPGLSDRARSYSSRVLPDSEDAIKARAEHRRRKMEMCVCERCGEMYERRTNNGKYCPACRKRAQRGQQAAWMREKRAKDVKEGNA